MNVFERADIVWQEIVLQLFVSNSIIDFLLAGAIFIGGVVLLKVLVHYIKAVDHKLVSHSAVTQLSHSLFTWPVKLIVYVVLFQISEFPLTLNVLQETVLHFGEGLIITLASIFYISTLGSRISKLIITSSPFKEDGVFAIYIRRIKNLIILITAIGVVFMFVFIQKDCFPFWMINSNWWRYPLSFIFIILLWSMSLIMGKLLFYMTTQLQGSDDQIRLRLILSSLLWPIRLLLLALIIYVTSNIFEFSGKIESLFNQTIKFLSIVAGVLLIYKLLDIIDNEMKRLVEREDNLLDKTFAQMVRLILRMAVLVVGLIYLIQTLSGQPISTLIAGLGIGALAVALAAQDTLKNLFGSIMIMADKPFNVGQRVVVDGFDGEIESVGFRSTQIRTLVGHQVTIPNEKMASSSIENIGRRPHIRRLTDIGITYDTSPDKVEKAVQIIREILENHEGMHADFPPRVYFNEFNEYSLNIRMIYWYRSSDYWASLDLAERINLKIMRAFEAEGIEFAFPTSTTYLAQDNKRKLQVGIKTKDLDDTPEG